MRDRSVRNSGTSSRRPAAHPVVVGWMRGDVLERFRELSGVGTASHRRCFAPDDRRPNGQPVMRLPESSRRTRRLQCIQVVPPSMRIGASCGSSLPHVDAAGGLVAPGFSTSSRRGVADGTHRLSHDDRMPSRSSSRSPLCGGPSRPGLRGAALGALSPPEARTDRFACARRQIGDGSGCDRG